MTSKRTDETNALVLIANGTEDLEVVTIIDILRRAKIAVTVASIPVSGSARSTSVVCAHQVHIIADKTFDECCDAEWDMVVLPGGNEGAQHFQDSKELLKLITSQHEKQKFIAAICASPGVVLARHGLLAHKRATGYPSMHKLIPNFVDEKVVVDGHIVTSQGPGTAILFALQLVALLQNKEAAREIAHALVVEDPFEKSTSSADNML